MKTDNIVTVGYPRSGNTFINYFLIKEYGNNKRNFWRHTAFALNNNENVIVPIRKPVDCISSYNSFLGNTAPVSPHIDYYIRFHENVLKNKKNILIAKFEDFISDLAILRESIKNKFGLISNSSYSILDIKDEMIKDSKEINLPRENFNPESVRKKILENEKYLECLELYEEIGKLAWQ